MTSTSQPQKRSGQLVKIFCEDEMTKMLRCEPTMTIGEIKEQFRWRFNVDEFGLYFEGRRLDDGTQLGAHGLEQQAVLSLKRNSFSSLSTKSSQSKLSSANNYSSSSLSNIRQRSVSCADADIDNDPKSRKTKILNFLAHFLKRRPSPEELIQAKILAERPQPLLVPPKLDIIKHACEWILTNAIDTEGLFRVSGGNADVKDLVEQLVSGNITFDKRNPMEVNPHAICAALKIYFREKAETLIPYKSYKAYIDSARMRQSGDENNQNQNCLALINSLPPENRCILLYLLRVLRTITQHSSTNKMTSMNMGVVFGPTLMRSQMKGMDSLTECEAQIQLVHSLIDSIDIVEQQSTQNQIQATTIEQQQQQQSQFPQQKQEETNNNSSSSSNEIAENKPIQPRMLPLQAMTESTNIPDSGPWLREISKEQALRELKGGSTGTFVLIQSEEFKGCYEALYITAHGEPLSIVIAHSPDGNGYCKQDDPFSFPTLKSLVQHYQDAGYFINVCPIGGFNGQSQSQSQNQSQPQNNEETQIIGSPKINPTQIPEPTTITVPQDIGTIIGILSKRDSNFNAKRKAAKDLQGLFASKESKATEHLSELSNRQLVGLLMCMGQTIATNL